MEISMSFLYPYKYTLNHADEQFIYLSTPCAWEDKQSNTLRMLLMVLINCRLSLLKLYQINA